MSTAGKVHPLQDNQMKAVAPDETVWLSASAGTGKTQVLSSRVLRLLLQPHVDPSQILCLTFTKAGATEMATRINSTLAEWVRLSETDLFQRLEAIGAPSGRETLARARTLFAEVLDCPGGGLRIDTIHAFSQWLLGAFPHEANLVPGTRPMEDRDRLILAKQVLAELLVDAEREPLGDPQFPAALAGLSIEMGPEGAENFLLRCAQAREAWFGPGGWQEPMRPHVMQLFGLPSDADENLVSILCADERFDTVSLRKCMEINNHWSAKTGQEAAVAISGWLASSPNERSASLENLQDVFLTKKGEPRSIKSQEKIDPAYSTYRDKVIENIAVVRETQILLTLAERLVPALRLGRAFALAWEEAKQREGLIDFDDQIREAARLLNRSELADWIRYKLDRRFDHILVDEAQDTNRAQWEIINALTGDFFAGAGQRGDVMRTLFVVGDYKQAIFRFQGTSPENFEAARKRVRKAMAGAVENARMLRSNHRPKELLELGLGRSFRTAQKVLDFVDDAIEGIGPENFGLDHVPDKHVGEARPGYVALWRPIGQASGESDDGFEEGDEGAESWLSRPDREFADRIARQVKDWTDPKGDGFRLVKGGERRATAGDVMVLLRKRRELAGLIVARLHAHGVPVAGVDRLRLGAPLAVRDLVSPLRFAAQPFDDLNLAGLLVSPLIGWSQEQLLEHGYREKGVHLWEHLRKASHPDVAELMQRLGQLLAIADYEPPQTLLHWLLTGPWQGRRKLVARLGREANDPIDELLNAAHAYAASATPSLVGFLKWFDAGEGELKREPDNAHGQVRVMTVHGAKGLQAPIVILADATGNPEDSRPSQFDLSDPADPTKRQIPLPPLRKEDRVGRIAEEYEESRIADEQEHWRLLYVAMTRAEEALFVGGALNSRDRGAPSPKSWYAQLQAMFGTNDWIEDPIWSGRLERGDRPAGIELEGEPEELPLPEVLPPWLERAPAAEPRPARPLAPSGLGEDDAPDPPYPPGSDSSAARRGTLIHKLLERLPAIAADEWEAAALAWLESNGRDFEAHQRYEMAKSALDVLSEPGWAELFGRGSLAEVPVMALLGDRVVAGSIDRLLVGEARVRIVDFKTARRPPQSIDEVPRPQLRQMAAYAAAIGKIFPGRLIEAALLYTAAPRLIVIPPDLLAAQKQALVEAQ